MTRLISIILFCTAYFSCFAQQNADCDTTVWFVNIYPGSEIYELEGHSALHIKTCDIDVAVNYGMFNFETPNFVYRFVKGETDYMVGVLPWQPFISSYLAGNRRIVEHKLNLSSEQKTRLFSLIDENLLPQNRVYRYNYVLDNCVTRPLRTVELAVGDTLMLDEPAKEYAPSLDSFRSYMKFYHQRYPWYQFGIDLALGSGIDRPVNNREKSFAPIVLDSQIENAKIGDTGKPLVVESIVLCDSQPFGAELEATAWYLTPDFVFWTIFIFVGYYSVRRLIVNRKYPRLIASFFFGLFGLAGILISFLIFISVHEATSPNINILWLNPLCFVPVICLWLKKCKFINYIYFLVNFVLTLSAGVCWCVGVQEPNSAFIPLILLDMLLSLLYIYFFRLKSEKKSQ